MLRRSLLSDRNWLKKLRLTNRSAVRPVTSAYYSHVAAQTSTCDSNLREWKKGDVVHGFIVDEVTPVNEMHLNAIRLTHLGTKARYLHLQRDDSNNVFSIGFRTTPNDSTGLPHILEHTTLCGSERFPCRDPFFKMLRRSLATFMNAITAPDYTTYPFSTQNLKDFRNLQSVYLDSVFKPNLRKEDFSQEGWRLEHSDVHDSKSPIIFKGVVFNEMKGVFNDNHQIFVWRLLNSILPSHTYGVISGGDPLEIPNLRHEDLVNFHSAYYHPSNASFYSYGNFPLDGHLKFINDRYLFLGDQMDRSQTAVPPEPRWTAPRKAYVLCRPDPLVADSARQHSIAIASLCNDITESQSNFEMYVLSQLLLDGPTSAFYKSLVDSNISTGFGPMTGFESQLKDTLFVVSLQGVQEKDFENVERIYKETLLNVIEEGFNKDHIDAVLHGIELQTKHQTSNFGLNLLYAVSPLWNHDGNVIQSLKINEAVGKLRNKLAANPKYLQEIVTKHLLNNNHQLVLTMSPDTQYETKAAIAEKELLEKKIKDLSQEEMTQIYEDGLSLLADQQKKEDVDVLPTLTIEDLKDDVDRYDYVDFNISDVPVQLSVQPTNGICYYRSILNTRDLSGELKSLLPVFNDVVAKMGTENYDYRAWDRIMHLKTGGLSFSNHVAESKDDSNKYEEGIITYSHCLDRNIPNMWEIWEELFNRVKLADLQRFSTLVKINAADLTNGIASVGHHYAMSSAASLISPVARLKENLSGLEYVGRMKQIAQMNDLTPILQKVQEISYHLLNKSRLRSALNLSKESKDSVLKDMESFYGALKGTAASSEVIFTTDQPVKTIETAVHYVFPYSTNYTSKVLSTVPFSHPDYAALNVVAKLLSTSYLLPEVREKGNAYGTGAKLAPDGCFMFFSYRDPNSTRTFDIFDGAWDFLQKYPLEEREIVEAKLGIFQGIDAPVAPGSRGMVRFSRGLTDDDMQQYRLRLKGVTMEHIFRVAEKYLKPNAPDVKIGRSLIGPANSDLAARPSDNWTVLTQEEKTQAQAVK